MQLLRVSTLFLCKYYVLNYVRFKLKDVNLIAEISFGSHFPELSNYTNLPNFQMHMKPLHEGANLT